MQHELDLQIALGRALMATSGYSAPVVADTLVRARALAERFDRPDHLAPLLYFQWGFHVGSGRARAGGVPCRADGEIGRDKKRSSHSADGSLYPRRQLLLSRRVRDGARPSRGV